MDILPREVFFLKHPLFSQQVWCVSLEKGLGFRVWGVSVLRFRGSGLGFICSIRALVPK